MAGFPFFTLAPVDTNTPQASPLVNQGGAGSAAQSAPVNPSGMATQAGEGNEGSRGFWQALQDQYLPPEEQGVADTLPLDLSLTEGGVEQISLDELVEVDESHIETVTFDEEDYIPIDLPLVESSTTMENSEWDEMETLGDTPVDHQEPRLNHEALQHIEAQRLADPKAYTVFDEPELAQSSPMTAATQRSTDMAAMVNGPVMNSKLPADGTKVESVGLVDLADEGLTQLESEGAVDVKALAQAMHQKPMTLADTTENGKSQTVNLVELAMASEGGSPETDGLISGFGQREGQAAVKPSSSPLNAAVATDKSSDIEAKISVPPSSAQWNEQVAKRIGIMVSEQVQQAKIQLDPPELGLLEVKVRVQQDQVHVAINSAHQVVRDALEAQSPRLRDLLEQQGVQLGQMDVSDHGQSEGRGSDSGSPSDQVASDWGADGEYDDAWVPVSNSQPSDGEVDYFA